MPLLLMTNSRHTSSKSSKAPSSLSHHQNLSEIVAHPTEVLTLIMFKIIKMRSVCKAHHVICQEEKCAWTGARTSNGHHGVLLLREFSTGVLRRPTGSFRVLDGLRVVEWGPRLGNIRVLLCPVRHADPMFLPATRTSLLRQRPVNSNQIGSSLKSSRT